MNKRMVFRFDIDTRQDLRLGVPVLLDLFSERDAVATFFVNMGKAVSRSMVLRNIFIKNGNYGGLVCPKLPARKKIGFFGIFEALLLNPQVGMSCPDVLCRLIEEGHELGLHGGTSHGAWQWNAQNMGFSGLQSEVRWGGDMFFKALGVKPQAFSSPGWNSPGELEKVLVREGYQYLADIHDSELDGVLRNGAENLLSSLNTNLAGEPGGVGFFESLAAKGLRASAVRDAILVKAEKFDNLVLYDHPAFTSKKEGSELLEAAVDVCIKEGIKIVTGSQMLSSYDV